MRRIAVITAAAFALATVLGLAVPQHASAAPVARSAPAVTALASDDGTAALIWAEDHAAGCWYSYGGESCSPGYDCSGIVQAAFLAIGIRLPRTTYGMLGSDHLREIPVSEAPRGALMFFGPGHVEIKTKWPGGTFGAQAPGTRVWWHRWSGYWHPTMAFLVVGG